MNNQDRIKELMAQKRELEKQIMSLKESTIKDGNVRLDISRFENGENHSVSVFIPIKKHWTKILYTKSTEETMTGITDLIADLEGVLGKLRKGEY